MSTQVVCNFQPSDEPVHTPVVVDDTPPKAVKAQWELLRRIGNLNELDLNAMGAGAQSYQNLVEVVERNVFEQIVAGNLMVDPKSGSRYQQWLARHFPFLASQRQSPKQVRNQLRKAQMAGESVPSILPFWAKDQTDGFAKFFGVQALENMVREVNTTLTRNGVNLNKHKRSELIQHLLEVGQMERNVAMTNAGTNGRRVAEHQALKAREEVMNLGISEQGVDELLKIINEGRTAFDELYVIANTYGVPVEALEGLGYFPRVFSDDAKFVVRHADDVVVSRWAESPSLGLEAAFQRSRNTDKFIVEDEIIIAKALGLMDKDTLKANRQGSRVLKREGARDKVIGNATEAANNTITARGAVTRAKQQQLVLQKQYDALIGAQAQLKRVERVIKGIDKRITKAKAEAQALVPSLDGTIKTTIEQEERLQQIPQLIENLKAQRLDQEQLADTIRNQVAATDSVRNQLRDATKTTDKLTASYETRREARQKALAAVKKLPTKEEVAAAQEATSGALGEARLALAEIITDEGVLKRELSKLPDATLNAMVDAGVLSKLPMHSREFYNFFVSKYKTPYKGIEELLVTDPVRAYNHAKRQLEQQIGKSMMTQSMYKDAVQNGWGVTDAMRQANMNEYGKYVKLDPQVLKKFGVNENIPGASNIYLHPMVVDQYSAILEVTTDPITMGTFASVWNFTNKLFKNQVLGTTGMVGRQVYQLFMSSVMGGTNLAHIVPDLYKYIQFNKVGFEVYDNTKKVFANGTMTEQELIRKLLENGEIGDDVAANIAGQGGFRSSETYSALNPANATRALGYWKSIIDQNGVFPKMKDGRVQWEAVEYGANLGFKFSAEQSGRLMSIAVFLENAFKVAHYRSTLRDGAANAAGQFATNGKRYHFVTMDDAVKHARNYFFDYSDVGVGDKLFRQNLIPFWMYQSRNVPAQIRNAMRNPAQFMAYQRLYALMNKDAREAKEDAPEGGFAPWMQGFGQTYMKHPTKQDTWFNIPFTSFDPIADATRVLVGTSDSIERSLGLYPGNFRDKLKQSDPTNHTVPFLDLLMTNSGGPLKAILGTVSNQDSLGRSLTQRPGKVTSLVGVEIPGKNAPLVKFLIENTLPSIGQLNQLNPGEVFGLREQKDARGNVIRPGQLSWAGGRRSDSDADVDGSRDEAWVTALRATGITVNTVDVALGMKYTETELAFAAKDMTAYAKQLKSALGKEQPGTEQHTKLYKEYITALAMAKEIGEGRTSAEDWLTKRGIESSSKQMKRRSSKSKDYTKTNAALTQMRGQ
jgi:hypothetical protein